MSDFGIFVAVSNTTARLCSVDKDGKTNFPWQEAGQQPQGSVNWLKNGKAFLTTQGGSVVAHVVETLKDKDKPPIILSLPSGPLLSRISGDGKCLVLVQSGVPGCINVYDLQSLLASTNGNPAKPPVVLQDHDRHIFAIAASSCTTHIASSNSMGAVYLHEAGSGSRSTLGALPGGATIMTPKRCLAFSQSNKPLRLGAGADDGQVLVWQVAPMVSGPVVMPTKLRGRVMGVGFAFYKQLSGVLLAISESGQLCVADVRGFPNVQSQASFSVELSVTVSCMAVREDGQYFAVGTKDGRVGVIRVEDLINNGQNITKLGLIRVFDLGTHLDVGDISFQRIRESRESRDLSRESRESSSAPVPPALSSELPLAAPQAPVTGTADGVGLQRQSQQDVQPAAARAASAAVVAGASQRPQPTLSSGAAATASGNATRPTSAGQSAASAAGASTAPSTTGSSSQPGAAQASGSLQPPASRHPAVPPVVIPGITPPPPVGQQRRPSDVGGGILGGSSSSTPIGGQSGAVDESVGGEGQMPPSPAARALAGVAAASTSSPVSSPSRPRSPRLTLSGGGFPPLRSQLSSGSDQLVANLRSYLDDFRQEVRDLVRGLQVDMVRQAVAAEMSHRNDIALLQQENRALWEEVRRLSDQLESNLRFGLLGQAGAPWQQ